jgi:hypothetical protein
MLKRGECHHADLVSAYAELEEEFQLAQKRGRAAVLQCLWMRKTKFEHRSVASSTP